jgi:hypothetical protein
MKKFCLLWVCLILLFGCTTFQAGTVSKKVSQLNLPCEVNKDQAIVIAQNFMLKDKSGLYSLTPKAVRKEINKYTSRENSFLYTPDKEYQNKELDVWVVGFSCEAPGLLPVPLPCFVHVNVADGKVIYSYMDSM